MIKAITKRFVSVVLSLASLGRGRTAPAGDSTSIQRGDTTSKPNILSRQNQWRMSFGISLLVFSGIHIPSAKDVRGLFAPDVTAELDAQLESIMKENNLPSVEVEILVPGKGRYSFVRGKANIAPGITRKPNEPFRIGSITKPFAATAILVLINQGRLWKTDTISHWYPDFPNADIITIDDLLRMRSGIPAPTKFWPVSTTIHLRPHRLLTRK